jgi:hypothetical protein
MKTTVTLTIDVEVLADYRAKRCPPLSSIVNDFLKDYLEMKVDVDDKDLESEVVRLKAICSAKEKELKKFKDKEEEGVIIL